MSTGNARHFSDVTWGEPSPSPERPLHATEATGIPAPKESSYGLRLHTVSQPRTNLPSATRAKKFALRDNGTILDRRTQEWTHASATVDDIKCDGATTMSVEARAPTLVLILEEVGRKLDFETCGGVSVGFADAGRGCVTFLPGGSMATGYSSSLKFVRRMVLEFDACELGRLLERLGLAGGDDLLSPRLMVADDRVERLCRLLAEECSEPGTNSEQYSDSLVFALMVGVARWRRKPSGKLPRGGLAPWQLRRSQTFMLEHISETIPLQTLADLAGVSLAHFSRAFKSSTGQSPYQWLIAARIEKAKAYLLEEPLPIAEISVALGFCDQAHMTRTFLKVVGTTPLAWQRAHLTANPATRSHEGRR